MSEQNGLMKPTLYLKQYRNRAKMTVQKLADISGWSTGYISEVENQRNNKQYTQAFIQDMAKALGVSVSELLEIDPANPHAAVNHTQNLPPMRDRELQSRTQKRSVPVSFDLDTRGWTVAVSAQPAVRDFAYIDESYADKDVMAWPIKDKSVNKLSAIAAFALSVPLSVRSVGDGSLVIIQRSREFEGVTEYRTLIRQISVAPDGAVSYVTCSDDPDLQEPIPRDDSVWKVVGAVFDLRASLPVPEKTIAFH